MNFTYGLKSNHPDEACEHYYFSFHFVKSQIIVAENTSSSCPFSGSYSVSNSSILLPVSDSGLGHQVEVGESINQHKETKSDMKSDSNQCTTLMQAGCSNSHSLEVRSSCELGQKEEKQSLVCHGVWSSPGSVNFHLILSSSRPQLSFFCLDYRDREGVVEARFLEASCSHPNGSHLSYVNISSTGPCILPLTAGDPLLSSTKTFSANSWFQIVLIVFLIFFDFFR